MSVVVQVVFSGLAAGSAYGLIAIGHTLVFRLTGIVHFALGDLAGLGVFLALLVTAGRGPVTTTAASSWRFGLGLLVALVVTSLLGWGTYFGFIHPFVMRGSTLGWVAATVAIAFGIQSLIAVFFPGSAYVFPDPLPLQHLGSDGTVVIAGAVVQVRAFFVLGLGLVLASAVGYGIGATRFGRGLQAIAADAEAAKLVGVPVDAWIGLAFALVGALAVLIAIAAAPSAPFTVGSGATLGLKGLVAALVVRFDSPGRAFAAGLGLGVFEAAVATGRVFGHGLGPAYSIVLPLALALFLLIVRHWSDVLEFE